MKLDKETVLHIIKLFEDKMEEEDFCIGEVFVHQVLDTLKCSHKDCHSDLCGKDCKCGCSRT